MSGVVWMSRAPIDSNVAKSLRHDMLDHDLDAIAEIADRIAAGESLDQRLFPTEMFYTPDRGSNLALPDFFKGGGYWIVSKRFAEVMRCFDLGSGHLYPVKISDSRTGQPIEGQFSCINFGNVKAALLPQHCKGLRPAPGGRWKVRAVCEDGDIAVSDVVNTGGDIWIDPALPLTFFLSDRLVMALSEAKADRGLGDYIPMRKCRIIQA